RRQHDRAEGDHRDPARRRRHRGRGHHGVGEGQAVIDSILSLAFIAQVIRLSVPLVYASVGGAVTERSGMIDLALEAKLLFGAFAAAAVAHATGSGLAGIAAGVAAGAAVAGVQAWL